MGFDGTEASTRLRSMLATLQPGGIILFKRNITAARQTWELLRESQKCVSTPAFLCVDMEGGTVDRLKDVIAPAPSVADIAASGNRKLFRLHGRVLGDECRVLGFNVDFAPVRGPRAGALAHGADLAHRLRRSQEGGRLRARISCAV